MSPYQTFAALQKIGNMGSKPTSEAAQHLSGATPPTTQGRPLAAVHANSRRRSAAFPKRAFEQVRSILLRSLTSMRTRRTSKSIEQMSAIGIAHP